MDRPQKLTVLETIKINNRLMVKVQCECGKVEIKRKDHVEKGRATSCKSCSCKRTATRFPPPVNRKGCEGLSGTHYLSIKHGASRRGVPFDVSPEYLWDLYQKQGGICGLTGIPITLTAAIKDNNVNWDVITASVDRIDNTKGYVEGNLWWVHKEVNRLKNNYSLEELLFWSNLITKKHGNPEPSAVKEIKVAAKVQRLTGEDSTNNPDTSAQPRNPAGEDIV